jgi:hypothetical protein
MSSFIAEWQDFLAEQAQLFMNRLIEVYILRFGKEKFADMLAKNQLPTEFL